jgi:hypothetical protein
LILTFKSAAERTAFLDRLEREAPDLRKQVRALATRPTDLTIREPEVSERVSALLSKDVTVHEEIQFRTMVAGF